MICACVDDILRVQCSQRDQIHEASCPPEDPPYSVEIKGFIKVISALGQYSLRYTGQIDLSCVRFLFFLPRLVIYDFSGLYFVLDFLRSVAAPALLTSPSSHSVNAADSPFSPEKSRIKCFLANKLHSSHPCIRRSLGNRAPR